MTTELDYENDDTLDEENDSFDDTNEQDGKGSDEGQNTKKNTSNFKALSKKAKEQARKIAELEEKLAKTQTNSDSDLRLYFLENPEAKEYKDTIIEMRSQEKYKNLDLEDIIELAKIKKPTPSDDKKDFDLISSSDVKKKEVKDLNPDEAVEKFKSWEINNTEYLEYMRSKGLLKI